MAGRWWIKKVRIANQFEPKGAEVTPTITALICVPSTKTDTKKEKPKEKPKIERKEN
jgi:L-fucose isomerase-like protein